MSILRSNKSKNKETLLFHTYSKLHVVFLASNSSILRFEIWRTSSKLKVLMYSLEIVNILG